MKRTSAGTVRWSCAWWPIILQRLGQELGDLVARRGGVPVHAPALAELPDLDPKAIAALVDALEKKPAKLFVFQTGAGTKALFAATDSVGFDGEFPENPFRSPKLRARGPKPTAALRARKVRVGHLCTTKELLSEISDIDLTGKTVVGAAPRHAETSSWIARSRARGAPACEEIRFYRWSLPADTKPLEDLIVALGRGEEIDAVAVTNVRAGQESVPGFKKSKSIY